MQQKLYNTTQSMASTWMHDILHKLIVLWSSQVTSQEWRFLYRKLILHNFICIKFAVT